MNLRAKTIIYSMKMAGIPLWRRVVHTKVKGDPAISETVSRAVSETIESLRSGKI